MEKSFMIFPIKYTYEQRVDMSKHDNPEQVFKIIQKCLLERNKDLRLSISYSTLRFDKSFLFTEKTNVFMPVDYGIFKMDVKRSCLIYEVRFAYLFLFSICFALLVSLEMRSLQGGLIAFFILGVVNWAIAIARNKKLFNKIVREVQLKSFSPISSSLSPTHKNDRSTHE
ncbi:MAG: hypothetical protein GXC73_17285 [Chitinophagaceae bacterium]|nr:hypothetical protein [Chitinophagaceae bacterium]